MKPSPDDSFAAGATYTLFSAVALSLSGLLGKIGGEQFSFFALVFWRFFSAFLLCLFLLASLGRLKVSAGASNFKMNFFRSFLTLGSQGSFYYYIQTNSLFNGMTLLNTGPLFIPVIEWAILRKHVGKSSWIAVIVCFLGVLCILQPDRTIFSYASLIGLSSGLFQGASQTLFDVTSKEERFDLGILILMFFCAAISFIPYLFSDATWEMGKGFSRSTLWLVLFLGIVSLLNQFTRAAAYRKATPSRVSPFLYFSVPFAGLFDWFMFGTLPNLLSVIGMILVIGGGLLKIYLRRKILEKK
jgi:drug/metabolite transporter (DMT)-like permease